LHPRFTRLLNISHMKPFVQRLPLTEDTSFVARTYRTPNFEVSWHQHIEYELILFTEGAGMSFVGNYVGEFETGDIFFLGSNLPHTFQKNGEMITSAVVVQFREDFWGQEFISMPECRLLKQLFDASKQGLKIQKQTRIKLQPLIKDLEHLHGFERVMVLCQCLFMIARDAEFIPLSTQDIKVLNPKDKERIDSVFQYTIDNFQEPISLSDIAKMIGMSIPAFCSYFKKSTKKTYTAFLNEVRIGYACKLLIDSNNAIVQICYESGFNSFSNFNKQFIKVRKMSPSQYRKLFKEI